MKLEYLTRLHMFDALSERADTVVGDFRMFVEMMPAYTQPKHGLAVMEGGKIYAVFGVVPMWQGVGEAWMVPTTRLSDRKISASRYIKNGFDMLVSELKMHRTQAAVKMGHASAHRLVRFVGMKSEGIMQRYGPDGADYMRYARW